MKKLSRRDICVSLPALAAVASSGHNVFAVELPAQSAPGTPTAPVEGGGTLGLARAIPFDSVKATKNANGGDRRVMLHGKLATGEPLELHQSMQTPGTPAPALHVIHHSELILVREGTLKFQHEVDGKLVDETVGPGGAFYIAYGTKHAVSNGGSTPARYFVVEIGGDA